MKQIQCSKQNLWMNWWSKKAITELMKQNHKTCSKQNHIQSHNPLCPHSLYGTPITDSELHHRFSQGQWGSHGECGGGLHSEQGRWVGATRFTRQAGAVRFLAASELNRSLSLSQTSSLFLSRTQRQLWICFNLILESFFFFWFRECRDKLLDFFIALRREIKDEDLLAQCRH